MKIKVQFVLVFGLVVMGCAGYFLFNTDSMPVLASSDNFRPPASTIPRTLFGLIINQAALKKDPWPVVPFGSIRLWDSGTGWSQMNPAPGKYDWNPLDKWFELISQHDNKVEDILFTFGRTPRFASSTPDDSTCGYAKWSGPGQCGAPTDVRPDGSGSDQYFKDFVTALVNHNKSSRTVHIKYWELWNEPYGHNFWGGTIPQLVRMTRDAATIIRAADPDAVIVAPCLGINVPPGHKWLQWYDEYLSAGGGDMADIMSIHGYIHRDGRQPGTKAFDNYYRQFYQILSKHGLQSKPIWDTEASWGPTHNFSSEDDQAAFVAQYYLVHWSYGVSRLYFYSYDGGEDGALWVPDGGGGGRVTKAGIAFEKAQNWLVGASMSEPCNQDGSIVTCSLTRNGHPAQIVWNTDGEKNIKPTATFKKMTDLDGNASSVSGQVRVGTKPVLLESQ